MYEVISIMHQDFPFLAHKILIQINVLDQLLNPLLFQLLTIFRNFIFMAWSQIRQSGNRPDGTPCSVLQVRQTQHIPLSEVRSLVIFHVPKAGGRPFFCLGVFWPLFKNSSHVMEFTLTVLPSPLMKFFLFPDWWQWYIIEWKGLCWSDGWTMQIEKNPLMNMLFNNDNWRHIFIRRV